MAQGHPGGELQLVSRRRLLGLAALGAVAGLAAACGSDRGRSGASRSRSTTSSSQPSATSTTSPSAPTSTSIPPPTSMPTTTATTTTTAPTTTAPVTTTTLGPPSEQEWSALADSLAGRLSRPGGATYVMDAELYDPRFDTIKPAGIAFCTSSDDVARAVDFARQHGLPITARSGGHSYGGYSTGKGLVVDVSMIAGVQIADGGRTAIVGAGARLIDVYAGLIGQGVCIPGGSCPSVGLAGLALGGGMGVLSRMYGLTCDRVTRLRLVTAAGQVVDADAERNSDLFWACRGGGGGNFGVVTTFWFDPFPAQDVTLFGASWPWGAASQLLPAWMEWVADAPDELWSNCIVSADPGAGVPSIYVGGLWAGGTGDAAAQFNRLVKKAGSPSDGPSMAQNTLHDAMFIEAGCQGLSQTACHLQGKYPGGTLSRDVQLAKSRIVNSPLGDAGVQAVLDGINERQAQNGPGAVAFDSWGGAINRVAPGATAFVHRQALASAQFAADFGPSPVAPDLVSAQRWLETWYAQVVPHMSNQAYQNYIDPQLAQWAQAYYGSNLPRLQRVKVQWDPDDLWRFPQGIPVP